MSDDILKPYVYRVTYSWSLKYVHCGFRDVMRRCCCCVDLLAVVVVVVGFGAGSMVISTSS